MTRNQKCILSEWLQLKLLLSCQRAVKPLELYASLLISMPDSIKNVLVLVEIMTVLSPCTASCERSFSAMNRIKTSLKTTMQQGTLQDLMTVSSSSEDIKSFDPKPAISNWFLSSKRKRHFVSASYSGHSSIAKGKNDSASGATEIVVEGEEEEILPPLPELPE